MLTAYTRQSPQRGCIRGSSYSILLIIFHSGRPIPSPTSSPSTFLGSFFPPLLFYHSHSHSPLLSSIHSLVLSHLYIYHGLTRVAGCAQDGPFSCFETEELQRLREREAQVRQEDSPLYSLCGKGPRLCISEIAARGQLSRRRSVCRSWRY